VADTIVPRLIAAGADPEKVKIVTAVHGEDGSGRRIFNLTQDLDALESLIKNLGDTRVLFLHAKNNLAAPCKGLAFRIEQRVITVGIDRTNHATHGHYLR
jgi:hypothetical protein